MFSVPHFDDMEELYSAYRPITPSLSNSRPSHSEQMKYSTQPTERIPLHDFRRDSLELYGLKPKHYSVEDAESEPACEPAPDSSDTGSAPLQPRWKDWILEKRRGIEELERQLDNFKLNGTENEIEEGSEDMRAKYKMFNPPADYKFSPFEDRNEEAAEVLSHDDILSNMNHNIHRSRWAADKIRSNIDKFFLKNSELLEEPEVIPGAYPRDVVYIPIPVKGEGEKERFEGEEYDKHVGPIIYLSYGILIPAAVKLCSFTLYHIVSLSRREYTFTSICLESGPLILGLDKIITGLLSLFAVQQCLDYVITFPLACHTRYHLLKYGIEIIRDGGSDIIWREYSREFLRFHNRALTEFRQKLQKKILFSALILAAFGLLSATFVSWIYAVTETEDSFGECLNTIIFGRAQLVAIIICFLGQTCYDLMAYIKHFIGEYAEDTMEMLMKKLDQYKQAQQDRKLVQTHHVSQGTEEMSGTVKGATGESKEQSSFRSSSKKSKHDVLLISTPDNSSSVVYHPQPYVSPLRGRSSLNSRSLHLVDPASPPQTRSKKVPAAKSFRKAFAGKAQERVRWRVTKMERGLLAISMYMVKLPFRVVFLPARMALRILPWRMYVSFNRG
ncbi:AaceriAAL051Cp [[Ashbya] aceris (nom. inval.)]|nr:AaceriAAL051Cp [[Ashbya] aceris (nom. inval.)]